MRKSYTGVEYIPTRIPQTLQDFLLSNDTPPNGSIQIESSLPVKTKQSPAERMNAGSTLV